ncbi:MFS transporter [Bacillus sp. EB600]|uniref:MFS transporter n=1 Tax=Bacillus sp. EB600 TaxID=2806345 RepID=UPI002108C9A2|nr:MFS transporter [Bacillus sp. EB600]MCQ6280588.1 MFS transporter [Bacillus sp. EB600]
MTLKKFKVIYTIFVFIALAAFDNIIIGLFPPLFQSIAKDLHVGVAKMGVVSAINILTTALSSVYWGYLSGRFKRKRLIMIGTLIWVLSVFLTAYSQSYLQLVFFQILTGIGLGCIASIGFSVLTDSIPYQYRGLILSLWGMTQGLGGIAGSLLASLVATSSTWRTPFILVGFIGFFLIILYLFVKEPVRGESDPELQEFIKEGSSYNYIIEAKHITGILFKGSNTYLFLQAFFMNITTGSLIWLPTLYIYKIIQQGYSTKTAIIAAGYLYAIFQLGGMTSAYFGHLGDKLQAKTYKGRALLTAVFVFLTAPFYIIMFMIPMTNISLPTDNNPIFILLSLLKEILVNPWIALIFVLSFFASAAQSANTPNWLALLTDVNLPEHRGTAFSVANLSNSLGRTLGNVGVGLLLSLVASYTKEPNSYIITLSLLQIFLIPSALCYVKMAKKNVKDIQNVKKTLNKRANNN